MTTTSTSATSKPSRTRRGEGFAGLGAVNQHDGSLPIYVCNTCGRDVVWATSKRTGRKYLVSVEHGFKGQRYYRGNNVHTDEACQSRVDADAREQAIIEADVKVRALVAEAQAAWSVEQGTDHPGYAEWTRLMEQASAIQREAHGS